MSVPLSIYYQNCRGLRTKTGDFYTASLITDYDVICVTESWLKPHINSSEVISGKYNIFRRDRHDTNSVKKDGGGILVGVSASVRAEMLTNLSGESVIEDLWVKITMTESEKKFLLCVCYFPPKTCFDDYFHFFERVTSRLESNPSAPFVMVGDFNLPDFSWNFEGGTGLECNVINNDVYNALKDFISFNCLFQFNGVSNVNGRVLDLCLCNRDGVEVRSSTSPFVVEDAHHPSLDIYVKIAVLKNPVKIRSEFQFFNANYEKIRDELSKTDWGVLLSASDVDVRVDAFYSLIDKLIVKYVPKRPDRNAKFPFWFSRETITTIKNKAKYHKKYKKFGNAIDYEIFIRLRSECKLLIRNDYKSHISSTEKNIRSNPKAFWTHVNSLKNSNKVPSVMTYNDSTFDDDFSIANAFSTYFGSVFESSEKPVLYKKKFMNTSTIAFNYIDIHSIKNKINNLDKNKGAGPDLIPPIFIKSCGELLADPLQIIFNHSLHQGKFPKKWKLAKIVPIFKKGKKDEVRNYRPISILSHFGKIFESIVTDFFFQQISPKLSYRQHGFFRGRSVLTNLAPYIDYITENIDKGNQVDSVYTDMTKAFDRVHHSTLMAILDDFGVVGTLLNWIESYLSDRRQFVVVNCISSVVMHVTSGVPQGSHFGPPLFAAYIDGIAACFLFTLFELFADDLKFYRSILSYQDLVLFQEDIDRLVVFCAERYFDLNIDKCCHITFTRKIDVIRFPLCVDGKVLNRVDQVRDLGIVLDSKFSFDLHIDGAVSRAFRMLGFVFRVTKDFTNAATLRSLYFSLVRSHLEFATPVWSPFYHKYIDRIERVQKKFIKTFNYRFDRSQLMCNYDDSLRKYNIMSLQNRRVFFDCIFLFRILNNHFNYPMIHYLTLNVSQYPDRRRALFYVPKARTNVRYHSVFLRVMRFCNWHLSRIDVFDVSVQVYKRAVTAYIQNM